VLLGVLGVLLAVSSRSQPVKANPPTASAAAVIKA
jgi:hypothetical protein